MRVYRWLLHVYPASFRYEYGEEMCAIFARRRRDASSLAAAALLWLSTIVEVLTNAAVVHWDVLRQDLAYTMRVLRRAPGFVATAVAIVALGIGATTAAFSVTDFVLIRPLPFPEPDRLVKIWERTPGYSRMELSPANYRDWTQGNHSFERSGAYHALEANVTGRREPLRLSGAALSADVLPTLGVQPLLGRVFAAADDREGAPGTVLLSYRLWQTEFGGDAAVVGQTITLDNAPYTIIGVMPREFRFPRSDATLWTTMRLGEANYQDRNDNWLEAVGRVRRGVTIEEARAELLVRAAQSKQQYPKENENVSAAVISFRDEVSEKSRLLVVALFAASACVLLIACANLASLLVARALERRRELAVRTAIGAGRERLVRQLMTESLLIATVGGTLGIVIAVSAVPLFAKLVPATLPIAETPAVDLRVLLFAAAVTALTGIAFGVAPVLRADSETGIRALNEGVRAGGGGRERLRSALVVAEIVGSIVLLVSAGLLIRALRTVQAIDPGFRPEGVLTLGTPLPLPQYATLSTREAFYARVLSGVRALPGVTSAAYISFLPMGLRMRGGIWPVAIDGTPVARTANQVAFLRYVTPGFFATLGIPVKSGRDVAESDTRDRQFVAVVSESFVRRYFPGVDPIGRHFNFVMNERVIVGVVGDVHVRGLERPSEPQVYLPYRQVDDGAIIGYIPQDLVVHTRVAGGATALVPAIRAIVRTADPQQPISDVLPLSDIIELETASRAVQVRVIGAFAAIAFLLAAVGVHGVLSFAVSQRVQEIGVRIALGAQPGDILKMVVTRSAALATAGLVLGVAFAFAAARSLQALLAGVPPADVPTFASAIALCGLMTTIGTLAPTIRALRVDPIAAIRSE
jgi:putative ABC transport system permease protein